MGRPQKLDLAGREFGRPGSPRKAVVLRDSGQRRPNGEVIWVYRCTGCGREQTATTSSLTAGNTAGCRRCAATERARANNAHQVRRKCRRRGCPVRFTSRRANHVYCSVACWPSSRKKR